MISMNFSYSTCAAGIDGLFAIVEVLRQIRPWGNKMSHQKSIHVEKHGPMDQHWWTHAPNWPQRHSARSPAIELESVCFCSILLLLLQRLFQSPWFELMRSPIKLPQYNQVYFLGSNIQPFMHLVHICMALLHGFDGNRYVFNHTLPATHATWTACRQVASPGLRQMPAQMPSGERLLQMGTPYRYYTVYMYICKYSWI